MPRRSLRTYKICAPRMYEQNPQKFIANIDQVQHEAWNHTIIRDWQQKLDVMLEDFSF
jgi:hypothetical protein